MTMFQFTPTTSVTDLRKNNTSASDTFPGWPNGVPVPGPVCPAGLGVSAIKLVHRTDWWGGASHPNIGVNSLDPAYAVKTVADMQRRGFDGCSVDWYGPGSNEDKALLVMLPEFVKQGFKFCICIDGGTKSIADPNQTVAQRTAALNVLFDYIAKTYYNSPAYLNYTLRPVVLFFGVTGVDWNVVRQHAPRGLYFFRWETTYAAHPQADGYYGWTSCNEEWIAGVKKLNKLIILGINASFNNTVAGAPVNCTWGVAHPKVIDPRGGLRWKEQLALAKAHPEIPIVQAATWNDYQEGSSLEPGIVGAPITLSRDGAKLTVTGATEAYGHIDLYISLDGEKLQGVGSFMSRPIDLVQLAQTLDLPLGTYTFYAYAVGINSVQNALSNPVTATLGWS